MRSPLAHIHPEAVIGENVTIDAFCVVEKGTRIGDGCHLLTHSVILEHTTLGKNCKVFPGAVIGAEPQDLKFNGEESTVEVGDNTVIRECVTIHRGTVDKHKTIIGNDCLLMAYAHIAHDCIIGNHVVIANTVQLAGHVEIGDYAIIGGLAAAIQFSKIGAHAYIAGGSEVIKDIPPFIKAGRVPLSYVGINSVGLQRRGFSPEKINAIQEIYRTLYLRGFNITQAKAVIEKEIPDSEEKNIILDFINQSKKGILKMAAKENPDEY